MYMYYCLWFPVQAWLGSLEVLWNNTSGIFVLSVVASLAVILATWAMKSHQQHNDNTPQKSHRQTTKLCDGDDENADDTHTQQTQQHTDEEEKLLPEQVKRLIQKPLWHLQYLYYFMSSIIYNKGIFHSCNLILF